MKRDEVHVAPVANPKTQREEVPVVVARAVNPKAKRATPQVVRNPKTKRSRVESSSTGQAINLQRRAAGLPAVVMNPKKRSLDAQLEKRAVLQATISVTPSRSSVFERVKRFLAGRAEKNLERRAPAAAASSTFSSTISRQVGVTRVVPNPKSPKFTSVGSASSSSAPSSTTTSRAASSTTTSKPTTTAAPSTTSTTTSAAPTSTGWPNGPMIAGGYYPDWVEDVMPPEAVNYKLFDLINYCSSPPPPSPSPPLAHLTSGVSVFAAFAIPTSDDNIQISSYSAGLLQRVVKLAHAANTKVVIAIGGWSDSGYFSGAVSTSSRRKTFVNNIVAFVNKYNLDGVDIDWCVRASSFSSVFG